MLRPVAKVGPRWIPALLCWIVLHGCGEENPPTNTAAGASGQGGAGSIAQSGARGFQSCQKVSWPYSLSPQRPSYFALNAASSVTSFDGCQPVLKATSSRRFFISLV